MSVLCPNICPEEESLKVPLDLPFPLRFKGHYSGSMVIQPPLDDPERRHINSTSRTLGSEQGKDFSAASLRLPPMPRISFSSEPQISLAP